MQAEGKNKNDPELISSIAFLLRKKTDLQNVIYQDSEIRGVEWGQRQRWERRLRKKP